MCSAHRVGINSKDILIEGGVNTDNISHLVVDFQLQRVHRSIEVDAVQVVHQQDLTITFSTVTRLGPFSRLSNLDYDHISIGSINFKRPETPKSNSRNNVPLELVEARIHFSIIDRTRTFSDRLE